MKVNLQTIFLCLITAQIYAQNKPVQPLLGIPKVEETVAAKEKKAKRNVYNGLKVKKK